jgi:hypothetical protein
MAHSVTRFGHFNTQLTFYIKLENSAHVTWEQTIAGPVPADRTLAQSFGALLAARSRRGWMQLGEYLLLQYIVARCDPARVGLLGWNQGDLLSFEWDTRICNTSCRFFYVTIRWELDHVMTSSDSESESDVP